MIRNIRLFSGPLLACLFWILPLGLNPASHKMAGIFAWVVTWWILEPIPLAMTSIVGACLAVVFGVSDANTVFAKFSDPIIYLFLGSFFLAHAMNRHGLAQRLTLLLLSKNFAGRSTIRVVLLLFIFTAALSSVLPNTPTMAIVMPIALAVLSSILPQKNQDQGLVILGLSYATSIGGTLTPLGTPPNLIAMGNLENLTGFQISFFGWVLAVFPFTLALGGFALWYFKRNLITPPVLPDLSELREDVKGLGKLSTPEIHTILAFLLAIVLWTLPNVLSGVLGANAPLVALLDQRLPESVAVLLPISLLFVLSDGSGGRTLNWHDARSIDWGTLLLFGGSLAMGGLMFETGLATELGNGLAKVFSHQPEWVFLGVFAFFTIFMSEVASNTACAALIVPVVIASCISMGYDTAVHSILITLACSMGFMLPVATPPNTLAYSTGKLTVRTMMSHGLVLNFVGWLFIIANLYWVKSVRDFILR